MNSHGVGVLEAHQILLALQPHFYLGPILEEKGGHLSSSVPLLLSFPGRLSVGPQLREDYFF